MAVTGSDPVLGALVAGQNIRDSLTLATDFVSDGGNIQPIVAQIRRGTGPWRNLQEMEPAVLGTQVKVRQLAFDGGFVGAAFESEAVTVAAPSVTAQTAYFGTQTLAGQGGFKPVDAEGSELNLVSIVSAGPTTPAAQIVDGRLCFAGIGAPNTATIRVAHATGEVDVLIETTPGKSIATPGQLATALNAQRTASAPINLYLRPGAYDMNNGGASPSGIFQSRNIPEAAKATIRKHPGQTGEAYFHKPNASLNSYWYSTTWVEIDGVDFAYLENESQMIVAGSSSGGAAGRTRNVTLKNLRFYGPRVPDAVLNDPTPWPSGYTGVLGRGPSFANAYNITLDNVTFNDMRSCGDYNPEGLVLKDVTVDRFYFDGIRIPSNIARIGPDGPCIIDGLKVTGGFAINNEMQATTGNLEPHNDVLQVTGGGRIRFLVVRNSYAAKGTYRGITFTTLQQNATVDRATYHENALLQSDVSWGRNDEGAEYNLVNQCTFAPSNLNAQTNLRFGVTVNGSPRPAVGEMRIRKTYVGTSSSGTPIYITLNSTDDPGSIVSEDSYYPASTPANTILQGPSNPATLDAVLLAARPQTGSVLDTNGIGALTTTGEFRGTEIPPLPGRAPTLSTAGGNVTITPSASLYYDTLPTVWEWRHRDGAGATWSSWTEATGANATGSGLAQSGRQFMYRWKNAAGVAGVPSVISVLP